jgi:hypothetical protein
MKLRGGKTLASTQTRPCVRTDELTSLCSLPSPALPSPPPPPLPCGHRTVSTQTQEKKYIFLFYFIFRFSVFGFQSPNSPSSAGFARRRRFFRPSSPSHPSKLYSSLGWLNSKVPKPFPPFSLRLIDVDGF